MNTFKKIYCRIFQTCFRIALPFLPYREPELIDGFKNVPAVLKKHHISHILLVTDPGVYKLGLTKPLEKQLSKSQISCTIYKDTVANPTSANVEDAKDLYLDHAVLPWTVQKQLVQDLPARISLFLRWKAS